MPTREMRGRYVQREWFSDYEFMTAHTAEEREVYLGLAMFADTTGWLPWNTEEIANSIYRFLPIKDAMERLAAAATALESTGRLKRYKCNHAVLPKLGKYPRAGWPGVSFKDEHARCGSKKSKDLQRSHEPQPYLTLPKPLPNTKREGNQDLRGRSRGGRPAGPNGPVAIGESETMKALRAQAEREAGG